MADIPVQGSYIRPEFDPLGIFPGKAEDAAWKSIGGQTLVNPGYRQGGPDSGKNLLLRAPAIGGDRAPIDDKLNAIVKQGAHNPFSYLDANRARADQLAALQMGRDGLGTSAASVAGRMGQAQSLQQALNAGAGVGVQAQARTALGGMAGDTAQARMKEYLAAQQGLQRGELGLRGSDIGVAGAGAQAGLRSVQQQADAGIRAAAIRNGSMNADQKAMLDLYGLYGMMRAKEEDQDEKTRNRLVGGGATVMGMF